MKHNLLNILLVFQHRYRNFEREQQEEEESEEQRRDIPGEKLTGIELIAGEGAVKSGKWGYEGRGRNEKTRKQPKYDRK
ncbi:hypothetical protein Csa_019644 [Cucumis sativus]|nr:hypothetical protein Csa_019644 [Cucumis sativus]